MNAPQSAKLYDPGLESTGERADLLASSGEDAPKTQTIAIYGKGGIGKSFTLANLSYMMAQQGKKVPTAPQHLGAELTTWLTARASRAGTGRTTASQSTAESGRGGRRPSAPSRSPASPARRVPPPVAP